MTSFNCVCGTHTQTKKNGDPWKHQTPDGVECNENSRVPSNEEVLHDSGYTLTQAVEAVNNTGQDETVLTGPQAVDAVLADAYLFELRIYNLSPTRLESQSWHQSNKDLARMAAVKAGFKPAGPVVFHAQSEADAGRITLVYAVPVKG